MAMDRAYIDYEKLEIMTQRGVIYVTKMKRNLKYKLLKDIIYQTPDGLMEVRIRHVSFTKEKKDKKIIHNARIVTYVAFAKARKRIETLFLQLCVQFMLIRNYVKDTERLFVWIIGKISALTILQYINYKNNKLVGRITYALI